MDTLHVEGRKWFDHVNGNTYHSVRVLADGQEVARVPFTYGYGSQYIETAREELDRLGMVPDMERYPSGGREALWRWCERHGVTFTQEVENVARRRDLHRGDGP